MSPILTFDLRSMWPGMNETRGDGSGSLPLHHLLIAAAEVVRKIMAQGLVWLSVCLRGDGVQRDQRSAIMDRGMRACVASPDTLY